jgi:hypothetical protein
LLRYNRSRLASHRVRNRGRVPLPWLSATDTWSFYRDGGDDDDFSLDLATEAHDGPNHFQLGLDFEYMVCDKVTLIAYIAHSFAQDDVERGDLADVTWFGLGLTAEV